MNINEQGNKLCKTYRPSELMLTDLTGSPNGHYRIYTQKILDLLSGFESCDFILL